MFNRTLLYSLLHLCFSLLGCALSCMHCLSVVFQDTRDPLYSRLMDRLPQQSSLVSQPGNGQLPQPWNLLHPDLMLGGQSSHHLNAGRRLDICLLQCIVTIFSPLQQIQWSG